MNKNFKVLQIQGLSGLIFFGFVLTCLFCGFVMFPVCAVMMGWNQLIVNYFKLPPINYFQASLLWSMVVILFYISLRNSVFIKIHSSEEELTDSEIHQIMNEMEQEQTQKTNSESK